MKKRAEVITFIAVVTFFILIVAGAPQSGTQLMVATTTSLYDSGLLDVVAEQYYEKYGVHLRFLALGSGQSLEHARRGDADAVLVHAPELENVFLSENAGGARKIIAYNFFAIVGPSDDPAGIENTSPTEALHRIAQTKATWVSRGDNSGTNIREKSLWAASGFESEELSDEDWYLESGSGMGTTLLIASERGAYTLADMGTYLKYRAENLIDLKVLVGEGKELLNVYSVMAINPENHPHLNFQEAVRFIKFLISEEGQKLIGEFGVKEYGHPLFYPAVQLLKENLDPQLANWIRECAFFDDSECPDQYRLGQDELYP